MIINCITGKCVIFNTGLIEMNNKKLFDFKRKGHPAILAAIYGVAMLAPVTGYSATDSDTLTITGNEANDQGYSAGTSSVASKTPTPRLNEAQSVSVVTRQQLDDYQATSLSDAMRFVSGVSEGNTLAGTEDGLSGVVLVPTLMVPFIATASAAVRVSILMPPPSGLKC